VLYLMEYNIDSMKIVTFQKVVL